MQQLPTWQFIYNSMLQQNAVMLLYVVDSTGSSPGRRGFLMAVNNKGEMAGSIGGGIMEHKFVELALYRLSQNTAECSLHKQVHDKSAAKDQSGMICSGEQTNLIYPIGQNDLQPIKEIILSLSQNLGGTLVLSPKGLQYTPANSITNEGFSFLNEQEWQYTQALGCRNHLNIIGAGHCALALSALMQNLDFYIRLFDDRQDLNTFNKNTFVNKKVLLENYSFVDNFIASGPNVYVVIMTMGYRTDDVALRALQYKTFAYLGVLGSGKKIEKMFADYRQTGLAETWLQSISAPAGIPIKSQTPEEIAVSIAAEIISIKNARLI